MTGDETSVWGNSEEMEEFYSTRFLELLVKYGYSWSPNDTTASEINLDQNSKAQFLSDFGQFVEGFDEQKASVMLRKIKENYKEEYCRLVAASKKKDESRFHWFPLAHQLFRESMVKESDEKSLAKESGVAGEASSFIDPLSPTLENFTYEEPLSPSFEDFTDDEPMSPQFETFMNEDSLSSKAEAFEDENMLSPIAEDSAIDESIVIISKQEALAEGNSLSSRDEAFMDSDSLPQLAEASGERNSALTTAEYTFRDLPFLESSPVTTFLSSNSTTFGSISLAARSSLSPAAKRSLSPLSRKSLSPADRKSISPISIRTLSPAARESLSPAARESLSPAARESLSPAARESLSPAARESLSPAAREPMTPAAATSISLDARAILPPAFKRIMSSSLESTSPMIQLICDKIENSENTSLLEAVKNQNQKNRVAFSLDAKPSTSPSARTSHSSTERTSLSPAFQRALSLSQFGTSQVKQTRESKKSDISKTNKVSNQERCSFMYEGRRHSFTYSAESLQAGNNAVVSPRHCNDRTCEKCLAMFLLSTRSTNRSSSDNVGKVLSPASKVQDTSNTSRKTEILSKKEKSYNRPSLFPYRTVYSNVQEIFQQGTEIEDHKDLNCSETRSIVQSIASFTVANVNRRSEFALRGASRGVDSNKNFMNRVISLLESLPPHLASESEAFILHFLYEALERK